MGALKPALLLSMMLCAPALSAERIATWRPQITEASLRFGVPARWIERVIDAESGGQTHLGGHPTTSRAGAMGLMQLMPTTWQALRTQLRLGSDPHKPRDNILAGTAYLRAMYDRFGYPGLFAAYNAGPARYAASLASGRALPRETRDYLASINEIGAVGATTAVDVPADRLFMLRREARGLAAPAESDQAEAALFVKLRSR